MMQKRETMPKIHSRYKELVHQFYEIGEDVKDLIRNALNAFPKATLLELLVSRNPNMEDREEVY